MEIETSDRQQLPTCDTYFVESMDQEEDGVFAARRPREERARMNSEVQMEIAEEMSRMVVEEYQEDILDHMEYMEVRRVSNRDRLPYAN